MANKKVFPAWPLQDAKARFSELVNTCIESGPQTVTKHGNPAVVIVPWEAYGKLAGRSRSLGEFLASAPRVDLAVERSREPERELDL
jgi:prevent-host-death family protein